MTGGTNQGISTGYQHRIALLTTDAPGNHESTGPQSSNPQVTPPDQAADPPDRQSTGSSPPLFRGGDGLRSSGAGTAHLVTEKELQAAIIEAARWHRWLVFHPHDSRRSQPGWPDLVLIRPPEIVFAELKTETGKLTAAQAHVLELLEGCDLEVHVWRPSQLDEVIARLSASR